MWIIVLAAFQFLDLRSSGWIVLIAPALIIVVLIAFCMILGIVRRLDAKLSASASARAVRRVGRERRSIVNADIRAREDARVCEGGLET